MECASEIRTKSVYIQTFGCQMNEHDSEIMLSFLEDLGYYPVDSFEDADLIIVNTCSIREKAEFKVYSTLGRFKELKEKKGNIIIGVAGCVAQQEGEQILKKAPFVDLVLGPDSIYRLHEIIPEVEKEKKKKIDIQLHSPEEKMVSLKKIRPSSSVKSYVTIMQGCDNYCTYCIVPYVRGSERSRPSSEIIEEVKRLASLGIKEIILLGQNVNSYGKKIMGEMDFPELLYHLDKIDGIERIRFTTSHPKDMSDELINCFGSLKKLCEHLHLPVQSGSNKILQLMGRGYTREHYLELVEKLRNVCPSLSITTDVIVGFPGENDRDFEDTLNLLREVEFDSIFSFKFSPRPGTVAASLPNQVSEQIKSERLIELQSIQREITLKKNIYYEGRTEEILVEGRSKRGSGMLQGRTRTNRVVNFYGGEDLVGKLVCVRIKKAYQNSLFGELVKEEGIWC